MSPKSKSSLLCFALILFLTIPMICSYENQSSANPISVTETSSGGILPGDSTNLQMIEATVLMEINESYGVEGEFEIYFDGNYTIYNSENYTETIIAAPFQSEYVNMNSTLTIEINGTEVDYYVLFYNYSNDSLNPWDDYFYSGWENRFFAICNASFAGRANTTIRYSFYTLFYGAHRDVADIIYDVGTARAWDGVTTETVEFRVYGNQPGFYMPNERFCDFEPDITNITNGNSYLWFWNQTTFTDECRQVYISYGYDHPWQTMYYATSPTNAYDNFFWVLFGVITIPFIYKKNKK